MKLLEIIDAIFDLIAVVIGGFFEGFAFLAGAIFQGLINGFIKGRRVIQP